MMIKIIITKQVLQMGSVTMYLLVVAKLTQWRCQMSEMLPIYSNIKTCSKKLYLQADVKRKRGCTLSILNHGTQKDCQSQICQCNASKQKTSFSYSYFVISFFTQVTAAFMPSPSLIRENGKTPRITRIFLFVQNSLKNIVFILFLPSFLIDWCKTNNFRFSK